MVWVAGTARPAELADVRCLVHRLREHGRRQLVVLGGRMTVADADVGNELVLAVPLPVAANGDDGKLAEVAAPDADADRKRHEVLENLKLCFPQVVRESLLARMLMDMDDDEDNEDDGDDQDRMQTLADKYVAEKAQEEVNMFETLSRKIIGIEEVRQQLGDGIAQMLAQNEYLRDDAAILVARVRAASQGDHYFAFEYSFATPLERHLAVPLSTRPFSAQLAKEAHLEPVTRRMDHQIFSLGADRRAGEANGAGKSPKEALHDMQLRHASGSQTLIVHPLRTPLEALAGLAADDAASADLRLRRIVGPWNTVQDLQLELASS